MQCLMQVNAGRWAQESYETASRDAGKRARQLRQMGYHVNVSSMGSQVTPWGMLKLTMVSIRPGAHEDTYGLPYVEMVQRVRDDASHHHTHDI